MTTGIRYQPLGVKLNDFPILNSDLITLGYITVHWSAITLGVPVTMGYKFYSNKRIDISSEIGLINSFLIKQNLTSTKYEQETDLYNDFIVSSSISLCLGIKINKRLYFFKAKLPISIERKQ